MINQNKRCQDDQAVPGSDMQGRDVLQMEADNNPDVIPDPDVSEKETAPEQQDAASSVTPDAPETKQKKKRTAKSYAISFFLKLGATALAVWLLLTFVAGICVCHSNASYPMIKDGDFCLFYRLSDPVQGDEIIYRKDGETHFGRVIAQSGDKVEIYNDYITVNGLGLYDDAVYPTSSKGSVIEYPYIVPDHCVFVLNDYRSDLSDSRSYGGIPLKDVCGSVVFIMRRRGI